MVHFPKCCICHQQFTLKGPIPYLLPCLHCVCETCVTSTAGGVISCSTCQREVNLTDTHLQKDVVRQREIFHLTIQHRPSEILCTHEDDGNQAVCWCQECQTFLCEYCQSLHDGFSSTRSHVVHNIGDIQPGVMDSDEYCQVHRKHLLEFWDKHCDNNICGKCRRTDHAEHDVEDMEVASDKAKSEIKKNLTKVSSAEDHYTSLTRTLRHQLRKTEEASVMLIEKIDSTVHSLKSKTDEIGNEMVAGINEQKENIKSTLGEKLRLTETGHRECKLTREYINKALVYSSKNDLLTLMNKIKETAYLCLESVPTVEHEEPILPVLNTERLDNLNFKMSSFGEVAEVGNAQSPGRNNGQGDKDGIQSSRIETKRGNGGPVDRRLRENHRSTSLRWRFWTVTFVCTVVIAVVAIFFQTLKTDVEILEVQLNTATSNLEEMQTLLNKATRERRRARKEIKEYNDRWRKAKKEIQRLSYLKKDRYGRDKGKEAVNKKNVDKVEDIEVLYKRMLSNKGVTPVLLASDTTSLILHCIHLEYDKDKNNLKWTQINIEKYLLNRPDNRSENNTKRFVKYEGTCSTAPLSPTGPPQYWEVKARVRIDKPLSESNLIMETGLCRDKYRDLLHSIPIRPHTYKLSITHCQAPVGFCMNAVRNGYLTKRLHGTLSNTVGSHAILHFGVLFDGFRSKIAFIDVQENRIISVFEKVDSSVHLWPMFGVYNSGLMRVAMKLIVGKDIEMTDEKKNLILSILS